MISKEIIQAFESYDHVMSSKEDLSEYVDKWLIICDNKIAASASDEDFDEIYNKFKEENPDKIPCVIKMIGGSGMLL